MAILPLDNSSPNPDSAHVTKLAKVLVTIGGVEVYKNVNGKSSEPQGGERSSKHDGENAQL